jgi:hypothetical protein
MGESRFPPIYDHELPRGSSSQSAVSQPHRRSGGAVAF